MVNDETFAVLVYAAMHAERGSGSRGLRWWHNGKSHHLSPLDYVEADRVMAMLKAENAASLRARYPEDAGESWDLDMVPRFPAALAFVDEPKPVEVVACIHCYEYQSCEHGDGWRESEAHAFCRALEGSILRELPGYDKAPWGWTEEEFKRRRGSAVSLSGMIAGRRR